MATIVKEQRLVDSSKRALLKYTIITDSNGGGANTLANTILVTVSSLQNSLNVNNKILGVGSDVKPFYKVDIKRIWGMGKNAGLVSLLWQGAGANVNSEIVTIGSGFFDYKFDDGGSLGGGFFVNPNALASGANGAGNILISVNTPAALDATTILIDIKKDAIYYDAGQTADPAAFNR